MNRKQRHRAAMRDVIVTTAPNPILRRSWLRKGRQSFQRQIRFALTVQRLHLGISMKEMIKRNREACREIAAYVADAPPDFVF